MILSGGNNIMKYDNYDKTRTETWHKVAPETKGYVVCSMDEATHVVFSEIDLKLAGKVGRSFTEYLVYTITKIKKSGEFLIIDDNGQEMIGFDSYIPCEYLKKGKPEVRLKQCVKSLSTKVVSLAEYRMERMK